jgi:hypothetical protein
MEKVCKICSEVYIGIKGTNICNLCKEIKRKNKLEKNRIYKIKNKEKIEIEQKNYRKNNKEIRKIYLEQNSENIKIKSKEYKLLNSEIIKIKRKEYRLKNKDKINEYRRNKLKNDPLYKLSTTIRNLIRKSIKDKFLKKSKRTEDIIGCSFMELKNHIEGLFTEGMSWENHGKWHLDHIIPISWAKDEDEVIKLNHYKNLQPLWAEDNLLKNNKFSG